MIYHDMSWSVLRGRFTVKNWPLSLRFFTRACEGIMTTLSVRRRRTSGGSMCASGSHWSSSSTRWVSYLCEPEGLCLRSNPLTRRRRGRSPRSYWSDSRDRIGLRRRSIRCFTRRRSTGRRCAFTLWTWSPSSRGRDDWSSGEERLDRGGMPMLWEHRYCGLCPFEINISKSKGVDCNICMF